MTVSTGSAYRITGGWKKYTVDQVYCSASIFEQPSWGMGFTGGNYTFTGDRMIVAVSDQGGSHVIAMNGPWKLSKDTDGKPTGITATVAGTQAFGAGTTAPTGGLIGPVKVTFTIRPAENAEGCVTS